MHSQELLCFGTQAGGGNAALVIQGDTATVAERQQFAHEQQRPACVFIDAAIGADGIDVPVLDYFYPHQRSPLCLHATLAAASVLLSPAQPRLCVRTALHGQALTLALVNGEVFVELNAQTPPAVEIAADLPARLLAAPGIVLASTPVIASVGSPKLLLEVHDSAVLQALQPDLAAVHRWGLAHGVSGCYVWCRWADGALEGRNFNHLDPKAEDSATGVAAGALAVHLNSALTLYQGANLGRPCLIRAECSDETIFIGGRVEYRAGS